MSSDSDDNLYPVLHRGQPGEVDLPSTHVNDISVWGSPCICPDITPPLTLRGGELKSKDVGVGDMETRLVHCDPGMTRPPGGSVAGPQRSYFGR